MTQRRFAAFANASTQNPDGTFHVAVCEADRTGYWQLEGRWPTLQAARQEAERLNADRGLNHEEVVRIIASSIAEHNAGWRTEDESILRGDDTTHP